ncbi:MAG TPA: hypothetical protein VHB27_24550, partial [Rhodopila sp.]|uniref:hypothetical protein n=1 Tax=Rhodopila sp. TaxID=2480087 RepID=UPI002C3A833E
RGILGGFPRVGFGFTLGILLYSLVRDGVGERVIRAVRRVPYASFLLYAALLGIFAFPHTFRGLYPLLAVATIVPAIIFIGAHLQPRQGLEIRIARFLGWISYPIYCLHVPILRAVIFLRGGTHGAGYPVATLAAAATLVLAVALAKWYEEPMRALLSRRLSPRPAQLVGSD